MNISLVKRLLTASPTWSGGRPKIFCTQHRGGRARTQNRVVLFPLIAFCQQQMPSYPRYLETEPKGEGQPETNFLLRRKDGGTWHGDGNTDGSWEMIQRKMGGNRAPW